MLGGNKHRTLREFTLSRCDDRRQKEEADNIDKQDTDEVMIPLFVEDTDGTPMKRKVSCVQP